jgi:hypothetical protein
VHGAGDGFDSLVRTVRGIQRHREFVGGLAHEIDGRDVSGKLPGEGSEVLPFRATAEDQPHGCVVGVDAVADRERIRRDRVVHPAHAVSLPHQLEAVRHAGERAQPRGDRVLADAGGVGGGGRGRGVGTVVRARDPRLGGQLVVRSELDAFEAETSRDDPVPRPLEDPQLGGAVVLYGAVAVQVIRLQVEQHGDLERELVHVLELERGELGDDPGILGWIEGGQRPPHVAAHGHGAPGGAKDLAQQLGRRRLALRAGHSQEGSRAQQPVTELDLAPDRQATPPRARHERVVARDAGALDDNVYDIQQCSLLVPEVNFDTGRLEPAHVHIRLAVGRDDTRPPLRECQGRRLPRAREPDDERAQREVAAHGVGGLKSKKSS